MTGIHVPLGNQRSKLLQYFQSAIHQGKFGKYLMKKNEKNFGKLFYKKFNFEAPMKKLKNEEYVEWFQQNYQWTSGNITISTTKFYRKSHGISWSTFSGYSWVK